jgi:hypothetical protein
MSGRKNRMGLNRASANGRKQQGRARRSAATRSFHPSQLKSNIQKHHKFRFIATAAYNGTITTKQMLGAAGVIADVLNTTGIAKNYSLKVKQIEIWTPPPSQGASTTCSVEWVGAGYQPNMEFSDSSNSVAEPAHVRCRPPPQTNASFWANGGTTQVFLNIAVPIGSILDLDLDLIENDGETPVTFALATAALGATYYLALDHTISDVLVPVSLTTTI